MNPIEAFFLNLNFSWICAKISPILLIFATSILFFFLFLKNPFFRNKILAFTTCSLFLIIPISTYFYFYPLYRGDIFDFAEQSKSNFKFSTNKKLVVFVLPDCPYCHESILFLDRLLKRNSNMEVEIWISGDQQDSFYKSIELKKVKILQNNEIDETIRLTHGIFPTYLITKNQKVVKLWTNQSFGARSLDEIEAFFKVHK